MRLAQVNDSLAAENARLRASLKNSFYTDSVQENTVKDTIRMQQYTYVVGKVVNNSIHQKKQYNYY